MTTTDRIGAPSDPKKRRQYCAAYLAAIMEARGYILLVRNKHFKHEALDSLDVMLRNLMDRVIEENAELRKPGEDNGFANTV